MPPDTICFLDFDHTLFDTDRFFHVDVQKSFLEIGVDIGLWKQTYDKVCLAGYTLEKHAEAIYREAKKELPLQRMREIIHGTFSNLEPYLFPDVLPFLTSIHPEKADLAILSFGNPEWQKFKIEASGIDIYFRYLFFTEKGNSKKDVVHRYANAYPHIMVVDNHPQELDAIKNLVPQARTFWVNRVPEQDVLSRLAEHSFLEARKYAAMAARHEHKKCVMLYEIGL